MGTQPNTARLRLKRVFTADLNGASPFDTVKWEKRNAIIQTAAGETIFEQTGLEFPDFFSPTSTNIAAQHYFKGRPGTPEREMSLKQVINRVVSTITNWGTDQEYFLDDEETQVFRDELTYMLLYQMAAFNSPVWYNVGVNQECHGYCFDFETGGIRRIREGEHRPQGSACFILHVEDDMQSILNWNFEEGMIFKYGSGAGLNISPIRSKKEYMTGGGKPSGPLSFAKGADVWAGSIKSGGKTRRAAKMLVMDIDHPDIEEFIWCKAKEEKKAQALIAAGFSAEFNAEDGAYASVFYQNANNSVRVTDEFMSLAEEGGKYWTKARMDGRNLEELEANGTLREMAKACWECGDPGIQFDTTINKANTVLDTERIHASNPCSEYMFLDNSACNLFSHNLMKYFKQEEDGPVFDRNSFIHACHIAALAQELIVPNAGYPTEKIAQRSSQYRTLGMGYANLGSLLMHWGLPYDSEEGRELAASITSLMSAAAYRMSGEIAIRKGPFPEFKNNQKSTHRVMRQHLDAAWEIKDMFDSKEIWEEVVECSTGAGLRNAQISLLAPTGTIGFLMDCDTTGVEPDLALVKYKKLVGGGMIKLVNAGIRAALVNLGYQNTEIVEMEKYVHEKGAMEGAPGLNPEHLAIFDCSFPAPGFKRTIHYMGHLRMMEAVQPFLSGAISKTVNMPESSSIEDIMDAYFKAWKMGLKAVAIYRDNCKKSQPMSTKKDSKGNLVPVAQAGPRQRKMPAKRNGLIHEFKVGNHKGYLTVGLYPDGTPGEIFIDISKEGSTVSGLLGCFAIATSFALQYGVPIEKFVEKFSHMKFEPAGYTGPVMGFASSIPDYIFRWLGNEFAKEQTVTTTVQADNESDAPPCDKCGNVMTRNGTCYKCSNCGITSGCS